MRPQRLLSGVSFLLMAAVAAVAQTTADEPAPAAGFTAVTPQYNFSYSPNPRQPQLPASGSWNLYTPGAVTSSTPGLTVGEYGIEGLKDTLYEAPGFTTGGTAAGGCSWNTPYDAPPLWSYDGGSTTNNQYEFLSGPILRAEGAVGTVYQSATQQVAGSGAMMSGFQALASWNTATYLTPPYLIGAIYFASNSCYAGDIEYGFTHYNDYSPAVDQFYFYNYANCPSPTGQPGSYSCYATKAKTQAQPQCSAAVNLPTVGLNSKGTSEYLWYAYVDKNPAPPAGNGHWVFNAGLRDPYTGASTWSCVGDPLGSPTFPTSTCPQTESASYTCDTPFPTSELYNVLGSVTATIANTSNTAVTGRANPMLKLGQLYIKVP